MVDSSWSIHAGTARALFRREIASACKLNRLGLLLDGVEILGVLFQLAVLFLEACVGGLHALELFLQRRVEHEVKEHTHGRPG